MSDNREYAKQFLFHLSLNFSSLRKEFREKVLEEIWKRNDLLKEIGYGIGYIFLSLTEEQKETILQLVNADGNFGRTV